MNSDQIRDLLAKVKDGEVGIDQALGQLRLMPFEDIGCAMIDHHRALRKGFPEVVFCQGKSTDQVVQIVGGLLATADTLLATRASPEVYEALRGVFDNIEYHPQANLIVIGEGVTVASDDLVLVITSGTADIPVAEEAAITATVMGNRVERLYDVGVAGLHRLLAHKEKLFEANVIIAVAGMEGALPSVISGLVASPVIAVPTSVGYGASFQGIAALLGMLNSCAPGIAVVNIDNGFGAGYLANTMNGLSRKKP